MVYQVNNQRFALSIPSRIKIRGILETVMKEEWRDDDCMSWLRGESSVIPEKRVLSDNSRPAPKEELTGGDAFIRVVFDKIDNLVFRLSRYKHEHIRGYSTIEGEFIISPDVAKKTLSFLGLDQESFGVGEITVGVSVLDIKGKQDGAKISVRARDREAIFAFQRDATGSKITFSCSFSGDDALRGDSTQKALEVVEEIENL